jgi:hypothetical protein
MTREAEAELGKLGRMLFDARSPARGTLAEECVFQRRIRFGARYDLWRSGRHRSW